MNFAEKQPMSIPLAAIRLRALVLAMGESVQPAWWKTEFLNEAGFRFLERLYPRTSFQAAVHSAGKVACYVHDRAVGRVGVYHLFRLPYVIEAEMSRVSPDNDKAFVSQFRASLSRLDRLMVLIDSLCDGVTGESAVSGAQRLGTDKDLTNLTSLQNTAAVYRRAFAQNRPGFPYFTEEQIGGGR